jgi:hypothetical protein
MLSVFTAASTADTGPDEIRSNFPRDVVRTVPPQPLLEPNGPTLNAITANVNTRDTFEVSPDQLVAPSRIVRGWFFYNNSAFDGRDPAANAADDAAVAPDKTAATSLSFPAPTAANVTSYDKGINGVMLDVAGLPAGAEVTAADFQFLVMTSRGLRGTPGRPSVDTTNAAPRASAIVVRRGAGVGGSDRVTITWPDGAIRNAWLSVRYRAADGVWQAPLLFGNLAGESFVDGTVAGSGGRFFRVGAVDLAAVMRARAGGATASLDSRYDFNRDGRVDALDLAVARANLGAVLRAFSAPRF